MPARLQVTGHYAGAVGRAAAAIVDIGLVFALFTLGLAGLDLLTRVILDVSITGNRSGLGWVIGFAVWAFTYMFVCLALAGRTPGKWLVGVRIVCADGSTLTIRRALVRTLVFPLSALLFGLGFIMIIFQREHRALHDLIAGTVVVYDWGGRAAELPGPLSAFIARNSDVDVLPTLPTVGSAGKPS